MKLTFEERIRQEAIDQIIREQISIPTVDILQECMPYQRKMILHPSKRKSIIGTRRSAKSFAIAIALINDALNTRNGTFYYLGLTNESAVRVMWKDIFNIIIQKYNLKVQLDSKQRMVFANGSIIYLMGLDATPRQKAKFRGQKFNGVAIDEAQDHEQDLGQSIKAVIEPALTQTKGTLYMAGTPGDKLGNHYYWQVMRPDSIENQWQRFFFDWRDNTSIEPTNGLRICDSYQQECDEMIAANPLIVNTPDWQREREGKWVISDSIRVYSFDDLTNTYIDPLPNDFKLGCRYVLGLDLGFSPDPTAFAIGAYNTHYDSKLRIVKSYKQNKMLTSEIAIEIKKLNAIYHFNQIIADAGALGKQIVADLNLTYGINIGAADKAGKLANINQINSDFITRDLLIDKNNNEELIKELLELIWDKKQLNENSKRVEDSSFDNHITDCLCYLYKASRHLWWKAPKPATTLSEANDKQRQLLINNMLDQNKNSQYKSIYSGIDFTNNTMNRRNFR